MILLLAAIYQLYLTLIVSYMHMHIINRVRRFVLQDNIESQNDLFFLGWRGYVLYGQRARLIGNTGYQFITHAYWPDKASSICRSRGKPSYGYGNSTISCKKDSRRTIVQTRQRGMNWYLTNNFAGEKAIAIIQLGKRHDRASYSSQRRRSRSQARVAALQAWAWCQTVICKA